MAAYIELVRAHAHLLTLLAPIIGAALAMASPGPRASWGIAVVAMLMTALIAIDAAARTLLGGGDITSIVEGVPLHADGVGVFGAALIACVTLLIVFAAGAQLDVFEKRVGPFALALLLCMAGGWIGALASRDLAGVFVAVETAWLAAVGLLALSPQRGALNGAMRMLGAGGVGAALFLVGAGLVYRSVGSLDLPLIAAAQIASADAAALGAGLMLLGLALKAGVAPLHDWMGAAFNRAGGPAAIALGALGVIGALMVIVRLAAYLIQAPAIGEGVSIALAVLGGASVVIGSVQAVGAHHFGRMAAYAGVAQAGGILLCLALGSPAGFAAALVQMTAFAATALALFGAAASARVQTLDGLDGLGRRSPLAGAAIMAGAISLMGAPLTLGFLGRWRLVEAGVGAGWWWAAGAVIFASLAGVFYGGRLIERLYFRRAGDLFLGGNSVWRMTMAPLLAVAIAALAYGVSPTALLVVTDNAAADMFGGAP